jgi:hypothetical protein
MLKFISTDSEGNNCYSSLLPEIKNIDDFLTNKSAKEIYDYINEKLEDNSNKKSSAIFVNKILPMLFFELTNKNNFAFGDSTKAIIDKILEVSILANEINSSHIENFLKFYSILANNIKGRHFLIIKFFNFLNKNYSNVNLLSEIEFKFDLIENMISDFLINDKSYERKEMDLFYDEFSLFIYNNKLFEFLQK